MGVDLDYWDMEASAEEGDLVNTDAAEGARDRKSVVWERVFRAV